MLGSSELALRIPSIISSFLCLISWYLIALKITDKKSALISLFSLSSMPLWIQYSRYASPDIPFVLCILLAILFFLQFLDSSQYTRRCLYILLSGFFISSSFFLRSYMTFVPLIGLSPFIFYNLNRKENFLKILYAIGILIGSIPTYLNLFFSYRKFGINGITSLFDFVKKQAIGDFDLSNFLLVPFNFLYLTFPVGILVVLFLVFTRPRKKLKYPLLIYFYPLISLLILLSMSTTYPHYYLFLLPSLSILFAIFLTSNSLKYTFSKTSIKYLLSLLIILITSIIIIFIVNYNDFIIEQSNGNKMLIYLVSLFLILSYIRSIQLLFNIDDLRKDLINFFYSIIIPQYISLLLLFNFGILGSPNLSAKLFLRDKLVSSIISSNTIYLFEVESKIQTLLSFYLPSSQVVQKFDDISNYKYLITSDINSLNALNIKPLFKSIKKFDNQFLLINVSK